MHEAPLTVATGQDRFLVGLAGRGILESRTPWMHEQEADAQGFRLVYSLFDFTDRGWQDQDLARLLDAAQMLGFAGLNITFPFKQTVIPLLDDLSEAAQAIGAVNSVAFRGGKRIGHNTDASGFAAGFVAGLADVPRGTVLQIGCGGGGAATAYTLLATLGAEAVLLFDRDAARAQALAAKLATDFGGARVICCTDPMETAARADGIVNATPMGMAKFPGLPLPAAAIEARHWVAEIVYFPLETELLASARAKGCRTLDGSGMAMHQAAEAFEIFTGQRADRQRMGESFVRFVGSGPQHAG